MRITVPHNTTRDAARQIVDQKIHQLLGQYGHYLSESQHAWDGHRLTFNGSARGFKASGSLEITESEVIVEGKLPLIAKPFEPRIRNTVEKEVAEMFRTA